MDEEAATKYLEVSKQTDMIGCQALRGDQKSTL